MIHKKPTLGRGLADLLGHGTSRPAPATGTSGPAAAPAAPGEELAKLPLDLLQRGKYQPRVDMRPETLQELADSIKAQGVVQPIVVRPLNVPANGPAGSAVASSSTGGAGMGVAAALGIGTGSGGSSSASGTGNSQRYEIIAGERRWRAAQMAGLTEIPAVIRRIPDEAAIAVALIENIQRENLNPLEEARALQRLINEFALTHQQAAEAVGRSRAGVSNLLRLLELAPEVSERVEKREIEMGHARALLALSNRKHQVDVSALIVKKGLSVRDTEALVRRMQQSPTSKPAEESPGDPNVNRLEQELAEKLGAKVAIQHSAAGKGKLVVTYNSLDELDGILAHIH
jgi:ParB family chromosome partitioning protein